MNKLTATVSLTVLVLTFLACMGGRWLLETPLEIAFGWTLYLYRVLPRVSVNGPSVLAAVVCLVAFAFGLHGLLRWIASPRMAQDNTPAPIVRPWPARWTGAILGLVLLAFVAGISAVGISHQTAWLLTSPERLIGSSAQALMLQQNSLKQLAVAMYDYQEANQRLPAAASYSKDGRPLLSWRVLLPYIEQDALFKEFHLDEPWDSPHNLRLLPRMPKTYFSPLDMEGNRLGRTHYQVFVGRGAAFDGREGLRVPADFPDGSSNTILITDAAEAVLWTKPEDLPYDRDLPLPALGHLPGTVFQVAFADGSVRTFDRSVSEEKLRKAINRDDGPDGNLDW